MSRKPQELNIQPKNKNQPDTRKRKGRFPQNPDNYPCPVCGGSDFEWGYVQGQVRYNPQKTMIFSGEPLKARVCLSCGNMLTFLGDSK